MRCGTINKTKDGRCKMCKKEKDANYYIKNCEKIKKRTAVWRISNPEKMKIYRARWIDVNPEKHEAVAKASRIKNIENIKTYNAAYQRANPEKHCINQQNRRARKRTNGGTLSKGLAHKLLKYQHGKCACCRKRLRNKYHLDHIIPLVLGGSNEDKNIQLLCPQCNLQKGAKYPLDFMRSKGFLL